MELICIALLLFYCVLLSVRISKRNIRVDAKHDLNLHHGVSARVERADGTVENVG